MQKGRTVIAAYRLPFSVLLKKGKVEIKQNSGGLVSAILSLTRGVIENEKIIWYGFLEKKENFKEEQFESESFIGKPVYISKDLNKLYYDGICNGTIWPLFHYYPFLTRYNEEEFAAYEAANNLFYKTLKKDLKEDDYVWIHDYHLFLLPGLIRKDFPNIKIGYFLHIPFPSFEIFRLLPTQWKTRIMEGLLGADIIGFHTNDYVQHFLKSLKRVLGIQNNIHYVKKDERIVKVDAFPISIDFELFNNASEAKEVVKIRNRIKKSIGNYKLIFSVDRLDYSKGLIYRLKGFEDFLNRFPVWHGKVKFFMVVVPSRDTILSYADMKKELEENIGRINGKYGKLDWTPINYQYRSLSFEELIALYTASDAALITPVRDGMNLVAKEFVASRKDLQGVLILSEMAGSAAELGEALLINPTDSQSVSKAIDQGLNMSPEEQKERLDIMRNRISTYNVFKWSEDFMSATETIVKLQKKMEVKLLQGENLNEILKAYKISAKRLLLLDYDGTLISFQNDPKKAIPDEEINRLITKLCEECEVYIISGRDNASLDKFLGNIDVNLVAEHGAFFKRAGQKWQDEVKSDQEWKQVVKEVMQKYVIRCNQSFIEEKQAGLVWHYRKSEPDFAFIRSRELLEELMDLSLLYDFNVMDGNKVIEVKNTNVNKGVAVRKIIEMENADFILCAGDDRTDEDMFQAATESAFTIKIGQEPSHAKYSVKNKDSLINLLWKFVSKKEGVFSHYDITMS